MHNEQTLVPEAMVPGMEELGWVFNPKAELHEQWVKDLGRGPVHEQNSSEWERDYGAVQAEVVKASRDLIAN